MFLEPDRILLIGSSGRRKQIKDGGSTARKMIPSGFAALSSGLTSSVSAATHGYDHMNDGSGLLSPLVDYASQMTSITDFA